MRNPLESVDVDKETTLALKHIHPNRELPSHDKVEDNSTHDEGDFSPKNDVLLNNGQGMKAKADDKHSDISKKSRFLLSFHFTLLNMLASMLHFKSNTSFSLSVVEISLFFFLFTPHIHESRA